MDPHPVDGSLTADEAALAAHPLVASLRDAERALVVATVTFERPAAGEALIEEGDVPGPLRLVLSGSATVSRGGRELATIRAGSWIGELAILEDRPSRTRVVAAEPMLLGAVPVEDAPIVLGVDAVALQLDDVARRRRAANIAHEVIPVVVTLRDGGDVTLRPLLPEDWRQLDEGDGRVSQRSLRMRFFGEAPSTERTFRQLTDVEWRDQFAWGAFDDGLLVGVGRHALQVEHRGAAELAVLVADAHQGRGLGRLLVEAVVVAADAHGADALIAVARADNTAIIALLADYGAAMRGGEEDGVVRARWPVHTALSAVRDPDVRDALAAVATAVLGPVVDR